MSDSNKIDVKKIKNNKNTNQEKYLVIFLSIPMLSLISNIFFKP